jgi:hypothetical protein
VESAAIESKWFCRVNLTSLAGNIATEKREGWKIDFED